MAVSGHVSGPTVVAVHITFTVLAFLATAGRLLTRIKLFHTGKEDIFITLAMTFSIFYTTCSCMQVKYGIGQHIWTLSPEAVTRLLIWFWISTWMYCLAMTFTKLSILFQYLRLFPHERFRLACYMLVGLNIAWSISSVLLCFFDCWPIPFNWDPAVKGRCIERLPIWYYNAALGILIDMCIVAFPLPILKSLNLPNRQRYILLLVFGLGGVVCVISIARLPAIHAASISTDISWDNALSAVWSSTEMNVGILCSCIPTLRTLFSRFFPGLLSTVAASGGSFVAQLPNTEQGGPAAGNATTDCQISATSVKSKSAESRKGSTYFGSNFSEMESKEMDYDVCEGDGTISSTAPGAPGIQVTTIVEHGREDVDGCKSSKADL